MQSNAVIGWAIALATINVPACITSAIASDTTAAHTHQPLPQQPAPDVIARVRAAHAALSPFTITVDAPGTFKGELSAELATTIKSMEPVLLRTDEHGRRSYALVASTLSFDGVATTREERLNLLASDRADLRTDIYLSSPTLRAWAPAAPMSDATVSLYPPLSPAEQAETLRLNRTPQARNISQDSPIHLALYVRDSLLAAADLITKPTTHSTTNAEAISLASASLGVEITVDPATGYITSAFFDERGDGDVLVVPTGTIPSITFPAPHPARWLVWAGADARARAAKGEPFDGQTTFAAAPTPKPASPEAAAARFDWKQLAATASVTTGPGEPVTWRAGDPWPPPDAATPR